MNRTRTITLVSGATGTVGRHVVAELLRAGHHVRALTRHPESVAPHVQLEPVHFDYLEPSSYAPALAGVDRLFLLSPTGHVDSAGLTGSFLEAAMRSVAKVVVLTAQGVDASDAIPHRRLELQVERSGLAHVILRPTWYADNFHTFWRPWIRSRGVIPLPAAASRTAFIDARDVAACAVAALTTSEHDGRTYVLTGPVALTYDEAAVVLSAASQRPIRYVDVSDEQFERDALHEGMPPDYAKMVVGLLAGVRAGGTSEVTTAVYGLTRHTPRSLMEYAADHADQWQPD
jgi:uncharacterized protein YbjT (DUF2867 family)